MGHFLRCAIVLVALAAIVLSLAGCRYSGGVRVERVIDGDTIVIQGGERVRYIGIDTPEQDEAYGRLATEANRGLVGGRLVRLETDVSDRDRYGRLLRYVFVRDIFVQAEMVRRGLARVKAYPPDTRHHQELSALEEEAREAGLGIWAP